MAGSGRQASVAPPRTLVVCCDGTWNDPTHQTNVWRTFELLRRLDKEGADVQERYRRTAAELISRENWERLFGR